MDRPELLTVTQIAGAWTIVIGLGLYGLWSVPLALFGPDRALIPGDLGDARYANYILEHFHQYVTGNVAHYWNAPFLYAMSNVVALSDNLLGTAPLYSLFRANGQPPDTAFQNWIIALFALNYGVSFFVFRAWTKNTVVAACGAFFFAFGIHTAPQLGHLQALPRFMLPVAVHFLWRWLNEGRWRLLLFSMLAVVLQFLCAFFVGLALLPVLFVLLLAHFIMHRKKAAWLPGRSPREWALLLAAPVLCGLLLTPLLLPYIEMASTMGERPFTSVVPSLPQPSSLFAAHPSALSWQDLANNDEPDPPASLIHCLFVGGIPWLALLLAPILLLSRSQPLEQRRALLAMMLAWALLTAITLDFHGWSAWRYLPSLPGFTSLRATELLLVFHVLFFAFILTKVAALLGRKPRSRILIGAALPLVLLLDQRLNIGRIERYDKLEARGEVDRIIRHLQEHISPGDKAVAYCAVLPVNTANELRKAVISRNLSAMLAGQRTGMPVVNGYTGPRPGNLAFIDQLDQATLLDWCLSNGLSMDRVRPVHNTHRAPIRQERLTLRTGSGKYVSNDLLQHDALVADKETPDAWESFALIHFADSTCALLAHTDKFVQAEVLKNGLLWASARELGDHGTFLFHRRSDGRYAFQAQNGRFVVVHGAQGRLVAIGDSTQADAWFTPAPLPPGYH